MSLLQLLLNFRNFTIENARSSAQITLTSSLISLNASSVQAGTQVAHLLAFALLLCPASIEACKLFLRISKLLLELLQTLLRSRISGLLQLHLLHLQARDSARKLINLLWLTIKLHAQVCSSFIDKVDGLIRKLTAGDVAVGQRSCSHECIIADSHLMVSFITTLQTTQNRDSVLNARFSDENLLEAALQSGVLLNVFAVFVECCCADHADLATSEHRLEHVSSVHRAFCSACAHNSVNLINESDDVTIRLADFVENSLEAFLKLATVLAAGHHRAQVESDQALILQAGRNVTGDDTLGKAFHNGGLTNACFADENRVVLRAALENLHDAANFTVAADHWVELAFTCLLGQVGGVFFQSFVGAFSVRARHMSASANSWHGLAQLVRAHACAREDISGVRRADGNADEQVFCGNVFVAKLAHFLLRVDERDGELAACVGLGGAGARCCWQLGECVAYLGADFLNVSPTCLQ